MHALALVDLKGNMLEYYAAHEYAAVNFLLDDDVKELFLSAVQEPSGLGCGFDANRVAIENQGDDDDDDDMNSVTVKLVLHPRDIFKNALLVHIEQMEKQIPGLIIDALFIKGGIDGLGMYHARRIAPVSQRMFNLIDYTLTKYAHEDAHTEEYVMALYKKQHSD